MEAQRQVYNDPFIKVLNEDRNTTESNCITFSKQRWNVAFDALPSIGSHYVSSVSLEVSAWS